MPRRFEHVRLSPKELSDQLSGLGMQPVDFRRLTGASPNAVRSWLLPENHPQSVEPPFWVTSWLAMFERSDEARAIAEQVAQADLITVEGRDSNG